MNRTSSLISAVGLALACTAVPLATASTATAGGVEARANKCSTEDRKYHNSGYAVAYRSTGCNGYLGKDKGNDRDWGDATGAFRGKTGPWRDTNNAESVINGGTYGGGVNVVAFYDYTAWTPGKGYGCLKRGSVVSDLSKKKYIRPNGTSTGKTMSNSVSSHRWVKASGCAGFIG